MDEALPEKAAIPTEVGLLICSNLVKCREHLQESEIQDLKAARYLGSGIADAAASFLFRRVKCKNQNKRVPQVRALHELSGSPLASCVREINMRLELRGRLRYDPEPSPGDLAFFNRWLEEIHIVLCKFSSTQNLTVAVDGLFDSSHLGHQIFALAWIRAIGRLARALPHFEKLRFEEEGTIGPWIMNMINQDLSNKLVAFNMVIGKDDPHTLGDRDVRIFGSMNLVERLHIKNEPFRGYIGSVSRPPINLQGFETLQTPALQQLTLEAVKITGRSLIMLLARQKAHLQHLFLRNIIISTELSNVLDLITTLPKLTRLAIITSPDVRDTPVWNPAEHAVFAGRLEELHLEMLQIPANRLTDLISSVRASLRHAHLRDLLTPRPGFSSVIEALKSCVSLNHVCIRRCLDGKLVTHRPLNVPRPRDQRGRLEISQLIKEVEAPTYGIRRDWRMSHVPIAYQEDRSIPFRLGELLRIVLSRGGNQYFCKSCLEDCGNCRRKIALDEPICDRVYDQEGFASLYPWADIWSGLAKREDVYRWDRATGETLVDAPADGKVEEEQEEGTELRDHDWTAG